MTGVSVGQSAIFLLLIYLLCTLTIGFIAMRRNRADSPTDYFLGGKLTGPIVLFFTMQATQYSGNTFFGFTGMAYRSGLIWILIVPILCLIITTQISFAPRLYVLSKMYHYLTPADYYADRYNSRLLRLLIALITIASMFPYLMIQARATGHAFVGITSGQFPFWMGVVFITGVMLVYIIIGGWRGVVWSDTLQGVMLTIAIIGATALFLTASGGVGEVLDYVRQTAPEKLNVPDSYKTLTSSWLSLLIASGIGFAMYPQAIQKIYAARSEKALRTGFTWMTCVPFIIGICTLFIGMAAWKNYPGLQGTESDQIFALMLNSILKEHYWFVVFALCGIMAAIMSTASSVVLSLASIFTRDIYSLAVSNEVDERTMIRVGRIFTVVFLGLVVLASLNTTATLWRLTEIKIEFLMQLFPALIIGLYWPRFTKWPAIVGLVVGCCVLAAMMFMGLQRWGYFQAGIYAFAINLAICVVMGLLMKPDENESLRIADKFFCPFKKKH